MTPQYKVMCGCEYCIYSKSMHFPLLTWRDCYLKQLKDRIQNAQNRRSDELSICLFETYKNSGRPHVYHL